jgi:hypothetical protein
VKRVLFLLLIISAPIHALSQRVYKFQAFLVSYYDNNKNEIGDWHDTSFTVKIDTTNRKLVINSTKIEEFDIPWFSLFNTDKDGSKKMNLTLKRGDKEYPATILLFEHIPHHSATLIIDYKNGSYWFRLRSE